MTNVQEVCIDLNNFGDIIGGLTPTFGLKANSGDTKAIPLIADDKRKVLEELSQLGGMLTALDPRDVSIWGQ